MQLNNIAVLQEAIRAAHQCESRHVKSVRVREPYAAELAWQGTVETFELLDRPAATQCYAWAYREYSQTKTMLILGSEEIPGPEAAVEAVIVARRAQRRRSGPGVSPDSDTTRNLVPRR
jgi:hypothetical protein